MRYLADLHISPLIVQALRAKGLDFSALIAAGGERRPSLVSLRLAFPTPERIAALLDQALPGIQPDLERGAIASIDESSVRIRPLPIL